MMTISRPTTSRPVSSRARATAIGGSALRSSWSEPYAPSRNRPASPAEDSFNSAPCSMLPVRRPTTTRSPSASSASSSGRTPGYTVVRWPGCASSSASSRRYVCHSAGNPRSIAASERPAARSSSRAICGSVLPSNACVAIGPAVP